MTHKYSEERIKQLKSFFEGKTIEKFDVAFNGEVFVFQFAGEEHPFGLQIYNEPYLETWSPMTAVAYPEKEDDGWHG